MSAPDVVIITGSRDWTDRLAIGERLNCYQRGTIVIHGDCRGADTIAAEKAAKLGFKVWPLPYFEVHGKEERNASMVMVGDALRRAGHSVTVEAFPLKTWGGTRKCMRIAENYGLRVRDNGLAKLEGSDR